MLGSPYAAKFPISPHMTSEMPSHQIRSLYTDGPASVGPSSSWEEPSTCEASSLAAGALAGGVLGGGGGRHGHHSSLFCLRFGAVAVGSVRLYLCQLEDTLGAVLIAGFLLF